METLNPIQRKLIVEHKLDIGKFMFYPNILVGEFAEGVHVTKQNAIQPIMMAKQIYGDVEPIIYISHRRFSYSMDPVGYGEVVKMFPNFAGFAIVSQKKYMRMLAALEKLFIKKPVKVFYDLDSAFIWAEELLAKATHK